MRLLLHPKVYSDIATIMQYYERVSTPELADEFYRELRRLPAGLLDLPFYGRVQRIANIL
jgi:hypothetical protein